MTEPGSTRVTPSSRVATRLRDAGGWLFDFDGTLTDYGVADMVALEQFRLSRFGTVDPGEFVVIAGEIRSEYYRAAAAGAAASGLDEFRVSGLLRRYRLAPDPDAIIEYQQALLTATQPLPDALSLLTDLQRFDSSPRRRSAIVTNAYDAIAQRRRLEGRGVAELVDLVVVAAEEGVFKPDPRLLEIAARRLGVASVDCVYVGDSVAFDVAAANAAGMVSVLVGPTDSRADLCVRDLGELRRVMRHVFTHEVSHDKKETP